MSASGDSVPLNPQYLLEALRAASSPSQELVHKAGNQLKAWEAQAGYWTLLQDAYLDRSLPVELRWMAIITLKQGVDKYWRKSANNAVSKAEKQHIRSRLISSSIDEPHAQLAVQNAVIIAKVARTEYPLEWPKVFTDITAIIRQSSQATANGQYDEQATLHLTRSLSILLHVVKELATGRLSRTKSNLQSITPEILKVLGDVYIGNVQVWQGLLGQQPVPEAAVHTMNISLLALKIMRRLIVCGYEFPNRAPEVSQAWTIFQQHIWSFYSAETEITASDDVAKMLKKHIVHIGKLFLDVISSHPAAFGLLPNTLELLSKYWEVVVGHGELLVAQGKKTVSGISGGDGEIEETEQEITRREFREKIALQGMLLFRGCIKMVYHPTSTFKYRHKEEKEEVKHTTDMFKAQLFTPQTVTHCMEVLVTKYFILRPSDLSAWEEDPEGWNEQWENSVESWEFMIRPCAEKLFNDLMVNHKDVLAQPLMDVFNSISTVAQDDILVKDAIYTAVGLAANVLFQALNFDQYIKETLVNEIQSQQPGYNILRRRIAIMIGQWVPVKIDPETRPTIYIIFQHLLNREDPLNDLVVRLTAAHNLSKTIDEWDFRVEPFLPYVDDLFNKLMALIDEVDQTDTRMGLLNVIGLIVDRLEHRVAGYADRIVHILPPLWEQTGDEHLFKQAILTMLSKLVGAMKSQSVQYHHLVLPLIRFSVDPAAGMQVYLLEDGLELWFATIKETPAPASAELLDLFQFILPCLETSSIILRRSLDIMESYVLLAPQYIIETYRVNLFTAFAALLDNLKAESVGIVVNIVETLLRCAKDIGGDTGLHVVGVELVNSQFLTKVFKTLKDSYNASQTTGPNKQYPPSAVLVTDYFSLLARVVTTSTAWFMEILRLISEREEQSVESIIEWLLTEWFNHFSNMGHPRQRKLNCLALTMLLETNQEWILKRLQDLMTVWTDVVTELREDQLPADHESVIHWQDAADTEENVSPERTRINHMLESDPVNSLDVVQTIRHHLQKVQAENGGPEAFQNTWVVNVDQEVLNDFSKLQII